MTTETPKNHNKFTKVAIIAAIVVVMNLFFNYAISLVYPEPQYNDYIPTTQVVTPITTEAGCVSVGGQWTGNAMYDPKVAPAANGDTSISSPGYCDPNYTNEMKYENAQKSYSRNVFIILVILSILSLIGGSIIANEILAPAFSWAGVHSLVIASGRYWSDANSLFKVIILALALGVLIWLSIKKFGK